MYGSEKTFYAVSSDVCPPELMQPVLWGILPWGEGPVLNMGVYLCEKVFDPDGWFLGGSFLVVPCMYL